MTLTDKKPVWQRQRDALRAFQEAAAARAELEAVCQEGFSQRNTANEQEYQQAQDQLNAAHDEQAGALVREAEETRKQLQEDFDDDVYAAEEEFEQVRQQTLKDYAREKSQAQSDFQDSRWSVTTLYEAGRKVAKDQYQSAQFRARSMVSQLQAQQQEALRLLQKWKFANDLPFNVEPSATAKAPDPWLALQMCATHGTNTLQQLRSLALPGRLKGPMPYVVLIFIWVLASVPAFLLDEWYYWMLANTITIVPFGLLLRYYLIQKATEIVTQLWRTLCQAHADSQKLRGRCLDLARKAYRQQRRENKKRNQEALYQAAAVARRRMQTLRQERGRAVREAHEKRVPLVAELNQTRDREIEALDAKLQESLSVLTSERDAALAEAGERFRKARDENNRRHAADWTRLVADWKSACEHFQTEMRAVDQQCQQAFASWSQCLEREWQLPDDLPSGLRFGTLAIRQDNLPNAVPTAPLLARVDLNGLTFPALLPFPERASLLFKAQYEGKAVAVNALQALLLRCWTALPAGKMRCTILDPVGRGENFSAFMHLADHDEMLVNSRIWTEAQHIDQRLGDLTTHMEIVLQKYLRNQFETLAEYNAQAGEVAEPFRFLVVADFPVNFTGDACRRLISLASAGARCGIYTFVMVDTNQPLPQGVDLADLERACLTLQWKTDHFLWPDRDLDKFPLEFDEPPDADTSTNILLKVGVQAKEASKVEVPFALIATPPEKWWQTDSRFGLSVALGRAGATARQDLTLGHGTAQHVLVAGKTGSGKSTLLHVLITQVAQRYSPDEVELYLIDFKKGVEFKAYAVHELPHARVVAVESEREFGLSVLQRLDSELIRRGDRFRALGVTDLPTYRNLRDSQKSNAHQGNGQALPAMPRVLLVVDEFQEFFVEDDKLAQEAALLLDRLVRQGRAFGIHVLLGSQTLGGAYSLARTTIDQMAVRIALQCSEADAHLILSKDNSDARLLSRPGEAIYNSANGLLEGNHLFQVVWLSDQERDESLRKIRQLGLHHKLQSNQIVFEGTAPSDLARNPLLRQLMTAPPDLNLKTPLSAWLGEAIAIKDPTAAVFRRQSGNNLLIVGQDDAAAFQMMLAALVSLSPSVGHVEKALQLVVASPLTSEGHAILENLPELLPVRHVPHRTLPETLIELNADLQQRLQGEQGPPRFLFLYGLQKLRELRRPEDEYGFGRKGTEESPFKLFTQLTREGPPLGIYTVLWCDNLTNLQRYLDRQALREFEMRVLLQMSANDSSALIDSPVASKLGLFRAFFVSEDQGRLEKFRPYGLPSLEWLREVRDMIKSHPQPRSATLAVSR